MRYLGSSGLMYDFIVVGAGSAGCVLADRLSADGRHRVLVLEAGGSDRRFYVQMPLGYGKTFYDPTLNWMYQADADPGLGGRVDYWPRGKVLGGSSAINAMVYIRGHAQDFEDWKAAGNSGWGWEEVLEAYRSMEDNATGADASRGRGGPLHISGVGPDVHPLADVFIKSAQAAGLRFNPDFNGPEQDGVGYYQLTARNGRRMSAARAFLRPAMKRANVRAETHAHATRILFDGTRAAGVEYIRGCETRTAHAAREVVVSAGAINSVQLLQLSGVGPPELLRTHAIAVRCANSNVGAHLQDHVGINYTWKMRVPTLNDELRPWSGKLRVGLRYLLARRGPLSLGINQAGGFFRSNPGHQRPNMQLYMQPFSTLLPRHGERPVLTPDPFPGLSLGLSNCRPSSRGEITIRSPDPFCDPRIVPNALSTAADVTEMLEAVKFLRAIAASQPFAGLVDEELRPGPACRTDEELIEDIRLRAGTVYHPACTCRMGPDPIDSVVDARMQVHGLRNLRVCDASAFPSLIAGNINAAVMMLGWRGAALILEDAAKRN
ncbi:MAG: GMC family oxidoreductase N-terminal domain-containing protein [Pseudomonadota bacterium]|nr:GMC family oxidoreductase N-terminal domain-containing protein [Pseudomonadota bacterium]